MWKNIFGKKDVQIAKEKKQEVKEKFKFKNVEKIQPDSSKEYTEEDAKKTEQTYIEEHPRNTEGLTEKEIEKKAEEGMKEMGFTPVEPSSDAQVKEGSEEVSKNRSKKWIPRIRGNDYCPCGSNKKFKKCCALDEQKVKKFEKFMDIRI